MLKLILKAALFLECLIELSINKASVVYLVNTTITEGICLAPMDSD